MLNLLFPKVCAGCNELLLRDEKVLCATCRFNLPLACHHRNDDPTFATVFYGRFPVEQATALLQFQKRGITQNILHNLKYRNQEHISGFFGKWLGGELSETKSYSTIDLVIPVPLHKQKLKKRGYNQVEGFGKAIANALNVPYRDDVLLKISKTNSQVFKERFSRFNPLWKEEGVFSLQKKEIIEGKHILLVDDIVTTGATLETCAQQLLKAKGIKLSLATIAIA
ncbi:ComF family protein [Marixanthomonas spongiae]|uniref:Amidophosphoribosyltransferase n=1 Tax=Marixanthomonas spongiae TaxID=2174845 RepID=A0A2U0HZ51_9FLAO|nr:phosphoribosyltransferase family protein [Marixanthomonas spongiae]PVW14143.1 amidophosphoribosyltransferase [Marixanthomonas spongiae]